MPPADRYAVKAPQTARWPGAITLAIAIAASTVTSLHAQPKRWFIFEGETDTFVRSSIGRRWNAGLLAGSENNGTDGPIIQVIGKDGWPNEFLLTVPGVKSIRIWDLAVGPNGEILVAAGGGTPEGRSASFFARRAADGGEWVITKTSPYCPRVITMTRGGVIWTIGQLRDEEHAGYVGCELRRYQPNGELLDSQGLGGPGCRFLRLGSLLSSPDRVGWYAPAAEYLEFSLEGILIGRYKNPADLGFPDGVAISTENDVVVGDFSKRGPGFLILNRWSGAWDPVYVQHEQAPKWAYVAGFDGTTLVTVQHNTLGRYRTK